MMMTALSLALSLPLCQRQRQRQRQRQSGRQQNQGDRMTRLRAAVAPPPAPPKVRRPQARVIDAPAYTIHDFYQKPFTMQLPLNPTSIITKTTIVCFKEEPHALKLARMLEGHKAINKAWPSTVFDEYTSLNLYAWDTQHFVMGNELYIMKWNFQDLRNYCADNIVDMMYIKSLKERGGEMSLKSDLIRLEMDHAFYVNRFTVMWSRE